MKIELDGGSYVLKCDDFMIYCYKFAINRFKNWRLVQNVLLPCSYKNAVMPVLFE